MASDPLPADYFDGTSARAHRVALRIDGDALCVDGDGVALRVPLAEARWPERMRHGTRTAHFRHGGSVQALDSGDWDAWSRKAGMGESAVVRAQQSWRGTLIALGLLLVVAVAGYRWGVPVLARGILAVMPTSVDRGIGDAALASLDKVLLLPSAVPEVRQKQIREQFAAALDHPGMSTSAPVYELRFHDSPTRSGTDGRTRLGPNAFAMPGGVIVVTDEMLKLLDGRDDVLIGVLGHELGHVRRRHGMRMLVQATLVGTASSLAWGDFSSLLATLPVLLGQSAYSRDFEREADTDAVTLLRANGISPAVMAELFERIGSYRASASGSGTAGKGADENAGQSSDQRIDQRSDQSSDKASEKRADGDDSAFDLGISLASHPADAERMRFFRAAAGN